jgi:undecaprenyl-diphosphatase
MRRRTPLVIGLASVTAAVVLGVAVMIGGGHPLGIDAWWMTWISTHRTAELIAVGAALNVVGGTVVSTVVTIVIVLVLLVRRRFWAASYVAIASVTSTVLVEVLKHLLGRVRPSDHLVAASGGAFPSGHSANAALISTVLAILIARRWVVVAATAYTLAMMTSRTIVNVHWLTDTVGGALIGAGVALALGAVLAQKVNDGRRLNARSASARRAHKQSA